MKADWAQMHVGKRLSQRAGVARKRANQFRPRHDDCDGNRDWAGRVFIKPFNDEKFIGAVRAALE